LPDPWAWAAGLYGAGVLVGLVRTDAGPWSKLGLALIWPLGPLAFVVTLAVLVGASLIAFPLVGAAVLLAAAAYAAI
jgi:hypothetical protein